MSHASSSNHIDLITEKIIESGHHTLITGSGRHEFFEQFVDEYESAYDHKIDALKFHSGSSDEDFFLELKRVYEKVKNRRYLLESLFTLRIPPDGWRCGDYYIFNEQCFRNTKKVPVIVNGKVKHTLPHKVLSRMEEYSCEFIRYEVAGEAFTEPLVSNTEIIDGKRFHQIPPIRVFVDGLESLSPMKTNDPRKLEALSLLYAICKDSNALNVQIVVNCSPEMVTKSVERAFSERVIAEDVSIDVFDRLFGFNGLECLVGADRVIVGDYKHAESFSWC